MDPRSTPTSALADPAGALETLASQQGASFDHIFEARRYTAERFDEIRSALDPPIPESASVVLFGSWARMEYTPHSDDDWAVLTRGADPEDASIADLVARCADVLGVDERKPGSQDVFGAAFSCEELIGRIGLDDDTNTNLTRRMLLLLESRNIVGEAHAPCWEAVLRKYLSRGTKEHRPPRFLLNDLVRYWRTICVDFEGKHRDGGDDDPKWVLRNAKLRTSRKILFAGGLVPVLLCHLMEAADMEAFVAKQFSAPATDRLAAAFLQQGALAEGVRTMSAYDRWIEMLQDESVREELAKLRQATRDASPLFREISDLGHEIDGGLLALLFETDLAPLTRRFGVI